MPVTTKTKWAQLKVGLLAIGALTILGFLVFLMSGIKPLFRSHADLYTYFNDSAAIAEGSPVTLNGITVGKISKVELSGDSAARPHRQGHAGDRRQVSSPRFRSDSQATLAAANLLGTKYINIKKGKSSQTVTAGAEIASRSRLIWRTCSRRATRPSPRRIVILDAAQRIVDQIEDGKGKIGKLILDDKLYNNLIEILNEFKQLPPI